MQPSSSSSQHMSENSPLVQLEEGEKAIDYLKRDNKKLIGSGNYFKNLSIAAFTGFIGLPICGIGYPIALLYHGVSMTGRLLRGKAAIEKRPWPPAAALEPIDMNKEKKPFSDRKYDLVLFGVTGFTGRLAAEYVAKQYGKSIKWAIAGRRESKLQEIRKALVEINSDLHDLPLIVADSSNTASLADMAKEARVICTTVGPFAVYGTPLVKVCVEHGTSYCDITGEIHWYQVLIDKFDDAARQNGSAIVSFCGHDSVPWSLLTLLCANRLKNEHGQELKEIRFYDEARSGPSGGTLATVIESFPPPPFKSSTGFDPMMKRPDGTKSEFKTNVANTILPSYTQEHRNGTWKGVFVMSMVNGKVVKRDNAILGYGKNVTYNEAESFPDGPTAFSRMCLYPILGVILALPPLRNSLLPKPGQGISSKEMENGFINIRAYASGTGGSKVSAQMYFKVDPGYKDTARMLVESGLSIALQRNQLNLKSGVLTPATCQGEVLLSRLLKTGTEFQWFSKA